MTLDTIAKDLRFGLRQLRNNPGFTTDNNSALTLK